MTTYSIDSYFSRRVDFVVIALRRAGYSAWAEVCSGHQQIATNAPKGVLLLVAGHGLFVECV